MSLQETIDRALTLHRGGALAEATALYRQAFTASGQHPTVANLLAIALDEQGFGDAAEDVLDQALAGVAQNEPASLEPALNLAQLRVRRGAIADAIEPLRRAAGLESPDTNARGLLFQIALDLRRRDLALDAAERLLCDEAGRAICVQAIETASRAGAAEIALEVARLASRACPDRAAFQLQIGNLLAAAGQAEEAKSHYRRCLITAPDISVAANNLANLLATSSAIGLAASRAPGSARRHYQHATIARGAYPDAEANLAKLLARLGEHDAAFSHAKRAVELEPGNANHHDGLGGVLHAMGRSDQAISVFKHALMIDPANAGAWTNLGAALKPSGRADLVLAAHAKALMVMPDLAVAHRNRGVQLADLADMAGARAAYDRALQLEPENAGLAFKAAMSFNTIVDSDEEIDAIRADIISKLAALRTSGGGIGDPMREVGLSNFYLAYHGRNDRQIQSSIATTYLALCPDLAWQAPHCAAPPSPDRAARIKIGFFSVFLHDHSIRYIAEGVIQNLDRQRFELFVVSNQPQSATSVFPPGAGPDHFIVVPNELELARRMIAAAELDILVYCDIGMEPLSYYLAFARLAPVQCVLQGHPVTTGIANVDYFISSAWQEPADYRDHYTEACVRLGDVAFFYIQEPQAKPGNRADFNLPEDRNLYFCPQTLFKFHPHFDAMLRGILERDPNGLLLLLRDRSAHRTRQLAERLEHSLGPIAGRVVWLERMTKERYYTLLSLSDVILDTPYFSGGNTTIQSLALGVPTVTHASPHVRGRITIGWMRILETMELVAETGADYADIAVACATDPAFRAAVCAKLSANSPRLFRRDAVVREHEDFFVAALDAARAGRPRLDWGPNPDPNRVSRDTGSAASPPNENTPRAP